LIGLQKLWHGGDESHKVLLYVPEDKVELQRRCTACIKACISGQYAHRRQEYTKRCISEDADICQTYFQTCPGQFTA